MFAPKISPWSSFLGRNSKDYSFFLKKISPSYTHLSSAISRGYYVYIYVEGTFMYRMTVLEISIYHSRIMIYDGR